MSKRRDGSDRRTPPTPKEKRLAVEAERRPAALRATHLGRHPILDVELRREDSPL